MINYQPLIKHWTDSPLAPWANQLQSQIDSRFNSERYGDLPRWLSVLERLPTDLTTDRIELDKATVTAST
ncbi:tRNA 5-methoxyuridine(34)/uridine 5-oxyacetic acid(34) synthase CmoB, partial [Halieaceae bacterium]|nr:tRNA 5-methoxyuridine(34)/uridine 5-oxyacetic acid(34) synthase CmoB [Halieaceae bacterium]